MIIDTHTHLNSPELYDKRDELIKKAVSFGVDKIIVIGYDLASSKLAVEIAKEYPNICFASVGIHPSELLKMGDNDLNEIEKLLNEKEVVALGEIGYEFHWDDVPFEVQEKYFKYQIQLADKYNKPIIIHMREATKSTLEMFNNQKKYLNNQGIIHCYSGSSESVSEFLKYGFYISFGGPLTFKNARVPKEAIKKVPLDRLLFETDCPYLAPHPYRGKENEPSNVVLVLNEASELLGISKEELGQIEVENAKKLFKL